MLIKNFEYNMCDYFTKTSKLYYAAGHYLEKVLSHSHDKAKF